MNTKFLLLLPAMVMMYIAGQAQTDTMRIFFQPGKYTLDKQTQTRLDSVFKKARATSIGAISITGYTDRNESDAQNRSLSILRANSIRDYVLAAGLPPVKMGRCQGLPPHGEFARVAVSEERKVEIVLHYGIVKNMKPITELTKMRAGESMELNGVRFSMNNEFSLQEENPELEKLAQLMQQNRKLKIRLEGHSCCNYTPGMTAYATDKDPNGVSRLRAKAVCDFLVKQGVSAERVSFVGFGASVPKIFPEKTETDRLLNKRVEVRVM